MPDRLGDKGTRQGRATLQWPTGDRRGLLDESFDLDPVQYWDELAGLLQKRADGFDQIREQIDLKSC